MTFDTSSELSSAVSSSQLQVPTVWQRSSQYSSAAAQDPPQPPSNLPGYEGIYFQRLKGFRIPIDDRKCEKTTTHANTLMEQVYRIGEHGVYQPVKKRKGPKDELALCSGADSITELQNEQAAEFDPIQFKILPYKWIITDNIAINELTSQRLRDLLVCLNPRVSKQIPSRTTVSRTVEKLYDKLLGPVTEELQSAITKVSFSFDLWSSKNQLALLGLCAHFIDDKGQPKTTLLALPRQYGQHTGAAIADTVGAIIADGHIFNLVAQAVLFNSDTDAFEHELEDLTLEEQQLDHWRKMGPIVKLHNIVVWINRSPLRCELLTKVQLELTASTRPAGKNETYKLITDVVTRWNSFYHSAERAVYLKAAIDELCSREQGRHRREHPKAATPKIFESVLTGDDWHAIKFYLEILEPIKTAFELLQGNAGGRFGAIWQVLPTYETVLSHFEGLRVQYPVCDWLSSCLSPVQSIPFSFLTAELR
ncbi:hypothetical protein KC316_g657 [Hortaea werneckii]|nr:hypothetical protein KC324_g205 [Hortaea werneckii]KAI7595226.1 hypothetical protein KC316_g657 [Hortaea werneckii]